MKKPATNIILNDGKLTGFSKIGNKARLSALTSPVQNCTGVSVQKGKKNKEKEKEEIKQGKK